mgnify:CR=1 FL=1
MAADPGQGLNRVGGADVCDPCFLGLAPERVRSRGWGLHIKQWQVTDHEGAVIGYGTDATLELPHNTGMHFRCRRKNVWRKLVSLVSPGVASGDELFDAHVHVVSKSVGMTQMVLADEGVQSIVMDMLGEGSWIELDRTSLRSYSIRDEYVSEARFSSEMCVLATHIERIRETGVGA